MARSMSPPSRTLTGLTSTRRDDAIALYDGKFAGSRALSRVPKNRDAVHAQCYLPEQLQPFRAHAVRCHEDPIAFHPVRPNSRRSPQRPDHRGRGTRWGRCGCLQRANSRRTMRQDDVRGGSGQFCRLFTNVVSPASSPARVDPYAATDDPAKLSQALLERPDPRLKIWIVAGCAQVRQCAASACAPAPRRDRPSSCCAAEQRDELARALTRSPRRRGRAAWAALQGRAPWPS